MLYTTQNKVITAHNNKQHNSRDNVRLGKIGTGQTLMESCSQILLVLWWKSVPLLQMH